MIQNSPSTQSLWFFTLNILVTMAFIAVFVSGVSVQAHAKSSKSKGGGNPKYASIVMDADTGLVLSESNSNKPLHPASLTKVMTLLLTFEALQEGRISLKDRIKISKRAAGMAPSKIGLPAGATIKVEDAILALVTKSANDIAVAVAEHLGGSESNFARMMTQRAREIGMSQTTFINASGLHDPRQISSARDMAKMARVVITLYPDQYKYFSRKNFTFNGHSYHNHNRLMSSYAGMDGMKTGFINASGFNLIASAVRNNRRVIGVVFGGRTAVSRNNHMAKLLDSAFARINDTRIAQAQIPLPTRKPASALLAQAGQPAAQGPVTLASVGNEKFGELLGQGDYDVINSRRIETGLIAVSAIKGGTAVQGHKIKPNPYSMMARQQVVKPSPTASVQQAAYHDLRAQAMEPWSIQVGAFNSREATDMALAKAVRALPSQYQKSKALIAPLKTGDGWLFRARLSGLSRAEAFKACEILRDCLPVAPQN